MAGNLAGNLTPSLAGKGQLGGSGWQRAGDATRR